MDKANNTYEPIDKLHSGQQGAAIYTYIKNSETNDIDMMKRLIQHVQKNQHCVLDIQNNNAESVRSYRPPRNACYETS